MTVRGAADIRRASLQCRELRRAAGLSGFPRIERFLDVAPEFPLGDIQSVFQVSAFVRHLPDLLGLLQDSNGIAVVRLAMQAE